MEEYMRKIHYSPQQTLNTSYLLLTNPHIYGVSVIYLFGIYPNSTSAFIHYKHIFCNEAMWFLLFSFWCFISGSLTHFRLFFHHWCVVAERLSWFTFQDHSIALCHCNYCTISVQNTQFSPLRIRRCTSYYANNWHTSATSVSSVTFTGLIERDWRILTVWRRTFRCHRKHSV